MTRKAGNEKSTSIAKPSRLKSSITLSNLNDRPSANWSCMKSIDQTLLICSGTVKGCGVSRTSRFLGLMRKLSSNSR
jgi:hypothetical protein